MCFSVFDSSSASIYFFPRVCSFWKRSVTTVIGKVNEPLKIIQWYITERLSSIFPERNLFHITIYLYAPYKAIHKSSP